MEPRFSGPYPLGCVMIAISYVWWMAQGCVFPIVSILLFRMKEVERLFVR